MLEIKNANKYFNKGKNNQIHVINNTSITLEDNGLIALLGPSGCGKTTLLNTIGGLDKLKSGSIYINNQKINNRLSYKTDQIRNLNIGYIFQDYKLIDNLNVYDNVSIVLKMIGIKDKNEIKNRVEYVLKKVRMLRYKKRPASMLSGGERQRVGIARAIVKDPDIILADEPTGNLDSKNSLEIMKIIKAISKDRLVILVTHEQNLAKFYATRIIEIKDGSIIQDYQNKHTDELDYQLDNTFYLKDFKNKEQITKETYDLKIYSNTKNKIKLDIVSLNGNIYIKSNTKDKIEVIDENSNIELINDHYKKITKEDIDKYKFNFQNIINKDIKKKYSAILNPITLIINGFKKVLEYPILKKILLAGFFLSGMFLMYALSTIYATMTVEDDDFVKYNKEYITIEQKQIKVEDYLEYEKLENINYIIPGDSIVNFNLPYNDYYQTSQIKDTLSGSIASIDMINSSSLIYGRMPENNYEIVVDKLTINRMFASNYAKMSGITQVEDILNRTVYLNNMNNFTIVGITDRHSPSIYTNSSMLINIIANSSNNNIDYYQEESTNNQNIIDYTLYQDKITLTKGTWPTNDYEVIVNILNQDTMPLNKEIDININNQKLKVVGYYNSKYDYDYYFTNNNTIKYNLIENKENITIYSKNKSITLTTLRNQQLNAKDSYQKSKEDYIKSRQEFINTSLLVSTIILIISLIEIFLMIRASFLSRVKEIGIYRAIGVKKLDIYKMFSGEIIAITTISSIPGLLLMAYILKTISEVASLSNYFIITIPLITTTIIFIYIFNLTIGLLPVFNTLRKTPAQILARYDID